VSLAGFSIVLLTSCRTFEDTLLLGLLLIAVSSSSCFSALQKDLVTVELLDLLHENSNSRSRSLQSC
jgi:hypothetical protein